MIYRYQHLLLLNILVFLLVQLMVKTILLNATNCDVWIIVDLVCKHVRRLDIVLPLFENSPYTNVVVAGIDRIPLGILANIGYEDLLFFQEVNIFISLSILLSPSISISNSVLISVSSCNLSGDVDN